MKSLMLILFVLGMNAPATAARDQSSIYIEEVDKAIDEGRKKMDEMKKQLEEIKETLSEWKEKADQAQNAKEYFDKLPAKYRPVSAEQAKKIFTKVKQGSDALERGQKWLESRVKQIESLKKRTDSASKYVKDLRKWDPEGARNNPYKGLEMISSLLDEGSKKFPPPLDRFVKGYGQAAKEFIEVLKGLQKKIENRAQGSVCANMATGDKVAVANHIQNKTSFECGYCTVGDFWPIFKKFSVTSCTSGGKGGDGGYILYDGSGTKDVFHVIEHRTVADRVRGWMSEPDFSDYRKTIKFLKTYIKAYNRDKDRLLDEMRALSDWKSLNEHQKCSGQDLSNKVTDLALADDYNDYLKFAITEKSQYDRLKTKPLDVLTGNYLVKGWTEKNGRAETGARVSFHASSEGASLTSTKSRARGQFCRLIGRSQVKGDLILKAQKGDLEGGGYISIDPSQFYYAKAINLRSTKDEENPLVAVLDSVEEITQEREEEDPDFTDLGDKEREKEEGEEKDKEDKSDKDEDDQGDEKEAEDKTEEGEPAESKDASREFCGAAIDDARTARDEFLVARDRFRNAFESDNASSSCESTRAGYYYVEMRRAAHKMRSILRALKSAMSRIDAESSEDLKWCREKLDRGGEILANIQSYRKAVHDRYQNNNCNVDKIVRDGEKLEPGLLPNEIDSSVSSSGTAGTWLPSSDDAVFSGVTFTAVCVSEEIIEAQASALGQALAQAEFGGAFSPVISTRQSGSSYITEVTGTTTSGSCSATLAIKFVTTFGESTGSQTISNTMTITGDADDCEVGTTTQSYTIDYTKVSDTCQ